MRVKDALKTVFRKKEDKLYNRLTTVWSEQADDENEIPLSEYPRPQMARKEWECLNGWWEYAFTGKDEAIRTAEGRILVPFSPESERSGVERMLMPGEALWYRRTIHIPEIREEKRLLLHFEAVDERCSVWWNGKRLGSHRGGYLPFSFDVTDHLKNGDNTVTVRVLDDTDQGTACRGKQKLEPGGMFYTAQSGIWQTVWMEWVPENYIQDMQITPDPDKEEVSIKIRMSGPVSGELHVLKAGTERKDQGAEEWEASCEIRERDFDSSGRALCRIHIRNPVLWTPESPVLYRFRINAGKDTVDGYFAMRSFGTGTDASGHPCLTLNHRPYFFHGVLDQGYWPESLMTAPSDEALIFDIREMKAAGFNMLRKHAKVEAQRWYYHCDRLGMVVWQDMVNGGGPINAMLCTYIPTALPSFGKHLPDNLYGLLSRKDQKAREYFEKQLMEMVRHLAGFPCIGMWVVFNEGWGQFDSVRLAGKVKQCDPTRLVDHASGWFDQGCGDICSVHNYFRELTVEKDPHGRPFVISEYGGAACRTPGHIYTENEYGYHSEDADTFSESFAALMKKIRGLSSQGLAGAVYTQVSDIQEELNGLLTYDRKVVKIRQSSEEE